jgi:hypothetical protein
MFAVCPFLLQRVEVVRTTSAWLYRSAGMKCPICKAETKQLEDSFFDGYAIKCPIHGEIEFSDTVRAMRMGDSGEAWERARTNARTRTTKDAETTSGTRPRILDCDFL